MTESESNINHAIRLLRGLVEKSPTSSRNRLRLLTLLYNSRRKQEFVVEALTYAANCDLTVNTDWEIICKMGRSIDPENSLFIRLSPINSQEFINSQRPTSQSEANIDAPGPASPEAEPSHDAQGELEKCEKPERRVLHDRRKEDRRKQFVQWCGKERRKKVRRQRRRRSSD